MIASPWDTQNQPGARKFGAMTPAAPAPQTAQPAVNYSGAGMAYNPNAGGPDVATQGWGPRQIKNRFTDALNRTGQVAGQAEDSYLGKATSFDAGAYADKTAQGIMGRWMPDLKQAIGDMRGQQVGMGRLDTGFATQDEDRLVTGATRDLNDALASTSMQAASLDQANTQGLRQFGTDYSNRYLEGIAGQYDMQTAEANAKKQKGGGLGKFLSGAVDIGSKFL